jgi:hypothetical protein
MDDRLHIHLDFTYSSDDLREAERLRRAQAAEAGRGQARRGVFGLLATAIAVTLLCLLNRRLNGPVAVRVPAQDESPLSSYTTLILCDCCLIILIAWFVVFRRLRAKQLLAVTQNPVSIDIDHAGVSLTERLVQTLWKWEAFDKWFESEERFSIRLTNTANYLVIPKRALAGPAEIDQLKDMLNHITQGPSGAFPVIPLGMPTQ